MTDFWLVFPADVFLSFIIKWNGWQTLIILIIFNNLLGLSGLCQSLSVSEVSVSLCRSLRSLSVSVGLCGLSVEGLEVFLIVVWGCGGGGAVQWHLLLKASYCVWKDWTVTELLLIFDTETLKPDTHQLMYWSVPSARSVCSLIV